MIHLDIQQGSPEWKLARLGIPTASNFDRIMQPKGRGLSASSKPYMHELLIEWLLGVPFDPASSGFMERGTAMEPLARQWYEFMYGVTVERVGFIVREDRMVGCSPDGLIGLYGGGEFKALSAKNHIAAQLRPDEAHNAQIQGCMWLAEREWWVCVYFHPTFPKIVRRVRRDDDFIADLASAVDGFVERLLATRQTLLDAGYVPREPYVDDGGLLTAADYSTDSEPIVATDEVQAAIEYQAPCPELAFLDEPGAKE